MGIGAIGSGNAAAAYAKPQRVEVEGKKTPVTRADLRGAIARAHEKITGKAASPQLLDTLTAQASLETGSGGSMYNYNFGGIKGGAPGTNETAKLRTKEVYDGKEVEVRDGFRAYRSLDAGAEDYVRLMKGRFSDAVSRAEVGDVNGFAHALKQANYYTADESKYASALNTLSGKPDGATSPASSLSMSTKASASNFNLGGGSSSSSTAFPDTADLSRVLDAIARHPITVNGEDDED